MSDIRCKILQVNDLARKILAGIKLKNVEKNEQPSVHFFTKLHRIYKAL